MIAIGLMLPPSKGSRASAHLDALRGLSAILVAVGHIRLMLVSNANEIAHTTLWQKAFYFLTSLGPSAVMIFFVLSGFFIGSSVVQEIQGDRFSWVRYGAARISRLYTVLVPALIFGAALDLAGAHFLAESIVYATPHYGWMLPASIPGNVTPLIALGYLFSVQDVYVPTLGSNQPLWSLANEFWYYLLFPLAAVALTTRSHLRRIICGALFIVVAVILTPSIRELFLVWLMGASIAFVPRISTQRLQTFFVGLALVAWLAAQSLKLIQSDYVTGLLASLLVYSITAEKMRPSSISYRGVTSWLSSISYTLYLVHTPFVVLVAALIVSRGPKMQPDLPGIASVFAVLGLALLYAAMMWFLFERHTARVKGWLNKLVSYFKRSFPQTRAALD